jgi:hypothetical protein
VGHDLYVHFRTLRPPSYVADEARDSFTEDSLINSPRFGGAFCLQKCNGNGILQSVCC